MNKFKQFLIIMARMVLYLISLLFTIPGLVFMVISMAFLGVASHLDQRPVEDISSFLEINR